MTLSPGRTAASLSEETLALAVQAARLGTWDLDLLTGALSWSPLCRAMWGVGPDAPVDMAVLRAGLHPDDRERVLGLIDAATAPGSRGEYDTEYRTVGIEDGVTRWLSARGRCLFDADGRGVRMIGLSVDITAQKEADSRLHAQNEELEARVAERTRALAEANRALIAQHAERERAEDRLRQSQKMEAVGRLTGGIAHDFNNMLSAIVGNLELLRGRVSDERAIRLIGNAMMASERGAKLTGQLLAFSRMQRLDLMPVDVGRLLDGLRDLLERALGPAITLDIVADPATGAAMADAEQLELALLNLANNARDAMPEGGAVTMTVAGEAHPAGMEDAGPYVVITIRDTGAGMPPEVRDRAFEPFYTTKGIGKGVGLGLSQVYGIARQSGGMVQIDSAPGAGTTVRLLLTRAPPEPIGDLPRERRTSSRRASVLVVDDDPDVRRSLVEILDVLGYAVTEAAHGPAGLEELERGQPDLMIVDFAMPGMNGAAVAREALRRRPGLPIVFATGYADTDALDGALRDLPLLRKPFRMAELASAVADALAR